MKKKTMLLSLFFVLSFSSIIYAYPTSFSLSVPKELQSKSNWCWAASAVSVLKEIGTTATQSGFSNIVKGNSTNNDTATTLEVKNGLSAYGRTSTRVTSSLSFSAIQAETYTSSRPIWFGIIYKSGAGGHAGVIGGFDSSVGNYVEVMDPAIGNYSIVEYNYLVNNGNYQWTDTLYRVY